MNPPLLLETLAREHQRELVAEAGRGRITAAIVGPGGHWWGSIAAVLRQLAVAPVTSRGSDELRAQMAVVDRA